MLSLNSDAQSKINGSVTDIEGKFLANANVLLLNVKDSSLIKGVITSRSGAFTFDNLSEGKFLITATFTGYQQIYTPVLSVIKNENLDLGALTLTETGKQLKEVSVSTKKPLFEQKIDRMVVNVKNSITSAGSTALDILERSPGVVVDRQTNDIAMNGKNGVVLMINGKLNRLPVEAVVQMLAGMSSGNIEKIELITTPPANYDAEGNAGFINIVMISNPDFGTNGSYSVTLGYGGGETSQGNVNFNHRKGKFNLYGDYSFSRFNQSQEFSFYRKIFYQNKTTETNSISERDPTQRNHTGRIGLDYQLNSKTNIGGVFSIYDNRWSMNADILGTVYVDNILDTTQKIGNKEVNAWRHKSANINLQHTINADEKLTLNVDFLKFSNSNPNDYLTSYYEGAGDFLYDEITSSSKITPITVWVSSIDYTKRLGKKISIESGAKASISRFTNDVIIKEFVNSVWKIDPLLSAKHNLKEDIAAAYSSADISVNDKLSIKLGLRYEYTTSNLGTATEKDIVDRKYGKLFPTFFISRKLNDKNSINFSYSRRITRPTFNQLAPFLYFLNPSTLIQGNPALQPAFSNTLKSDYTFKRNIFSISYSHIKDAIIRFQAKVDPTSNKQVITGENLKSFHTVAASFSVPLIINKWWNMQNNLIATWQQANTTYNNEPIEIQQANYRVTSAQNFKLPKEISVEISGFFQSLSLSGRAISKSFGSLNLGVQKKLKSEKGTFRFNVSDILNTFRFRNYQNFPELNLVTRGALQFGQRTFSFTYSHNFGNEKLKAKRNIQGAEEERRRVE